MLTNVAEKIYDCKNNSAMNWTSLVCLIVIIVEPLDVRRNNANTELNKHALLGQVQNVQKDLSRAPIVAKCAETYNIKGALPLGHLQK